MKNLNNLLYSSIKAVLLSGKKVSEIYNTNFELYYKNDQSPVTEADIESNKIIQDVLKIYKLPFLSEESYLTPYDIRKEWEYYWLIDPIDGTKEFINRNDEFTINIALIKKNQPIIGVVFSPMTSELYFGSQIEFSKKIHLDISNINNINIEQLISKGIKLPFEKKRDNYVVLTSRSHLSPTTSNYINFLKKNNPNLEVVKMGSSLKICKIADGEADIYPRFGPTKEWDTAAGHAILKYSGGNLLNGDGNELIYNKPNVVNPNFTAQLKIKQSF